MASNLKSLSHGDGKLPLFNGTTIQIHEDISACLLKVGLEKSELNDLEQSGFARIEKGKSLILMDIGPPAELDLSRNCHAGTHSFEMSRGAQRLIVNCGDASFVQDLGGHQLDVSARGTAAHSTLILDNRDSSEICEDGLIAAV